MPRPQQRQPAQPEPTSRGHNAGGEDGRVPTRPLTCMMDGMQSHARGAQAVALAHACMHACGDVTGEAEEEWARRPLPGSSTPLRRCGRPCMCVPSVLLAPAARTHPCLWPASRCARPQLTQHSTTTCTAYTPCSAPACTRAARGRPVLLQPAPSPQPAPHAEHPAPFWWALAKPAVPRASWHHVITQAWILSGRRLGESTWSPMLCQRACPSCLACGMRHVARAGR